MNFNRVEFIEINWFGRNNDIQELIIKTYDLKSKYNSIYIDEQHNDTYIVCKLENGIQGFDKEEKIEAFNELNINDGNRRTIDSIDISFWSLDYILEDMIEKGVLERGNYLISYSW